eukprot:757620-Hanusia_phi.AAC.4
MVGVSAEKAAANLLGNEEKSRKLTAKRFAEGDKPIDGPAYNSSATPDVSSSSLSLTWLACRLSPSRGRGRRRWRSEEEGGSVSSDGVSLDGGETKEEAQVFLPPRPHVSLLADSLLQHRVPLLQLFHERLQPDLPVCRRLVAALLPSQLLQPAAVQLLLHFLQPPPGRRKLVGKRLARKALELFPDVLVSDKETAETRTKEESESRKGGDRREEGGGRREEEEGGRGR